MLQAGAWARRARSAMAPPPGPSPWRGPGSHLGGEAAGSAAGSAARVEEKIAPGHVGEWRAGGGGEGGHRTGPNPRHAPLFRGRSRRPTDLLRRDVDERENCSRTPGAADRKGSSLREGANTWRLSFSGPGPATSAAGLDWGLVPSSARTCLRPSDHRLGTSMPPGDTSPALGRVRWLHRRLAAPRGAGLRRGRRAGPGP